MQKTRFNIESENFNRMKKYFRIVLLGNKNDGWLLLMKLFGKWHMVWRIKHKSETVNGMVIMPYDEKTPETLFNQISAANA